MFLLDSLTSLLTFILNSFCSVNQQTSIKDRFFNYLKATPISGQENSISGQFASRHTCSICGRAHSSRYQTRHSLASEEISRSGICSRCVRSVHTTSQEHLPEIRAIYEVHHYHHTCSCQTTACTAVKKSPVKLSAVLSSKMQQLRHSHPFKVYRLYTLSPVDSEQPSSFIRTHLKPTISTSLPY